MLFQCLCIITHIDFHLTSIVFSSFPFALFRSSSVRIVYGTCFQLQPKRYVNTFYVDHHHHGSSINYFHQLCVDVAVSNAYWLILPLCKWKKVQHTKWKYPDIQSIRKTFAHCARYFKITIDLVIGIDLNIICNAMCCVLLSLYYSFECVIHRSMCRSALVLLNFELN